MSSSGQMRKIRDMRAKLYRETILYVGTGLLGVCVVALVLAAVGVDGPGKLLFWGLVAVFCYFTIASFAIILGEEVMPSQTRRELLLLEQETFGKSKRIGLDDLDDGEISSVVDEIQASLDAQVS